MWWRLRLDETVPDSQRVMSTIRSYLDARFPWSSISLGPPLSFHRDSRCPSGAGARDWGVACTGCCRWRMQLPWPVLCSACSGAAALVFSAQFGTHACTKGHLGGLFTPTHPVSTPNNLSARRVLLRSPAYPWARVRGRSPRGRGRREKNDGGKTGGEKKTGVAVDKHR